MTQHGFARDRTFEWSERTPTSCTLVLTDDAESWLHFPYACGRKCQFTNLDMTFEITNTGNEPLPVSLGGHPTFNWPLLSGLPKEAYAITFSHEELEPIPRLNEELLRDKPGPTLIRGNSLALSQQLFANDAVILDRPASHTVRYGADRGPSISVSWQGFRQLGIWSKPQGAPFICIEPWYGLPHRPTLTGNLSISRAY
jgi:galactose mutarotase-like enzyme